MARKRGWASSTRRNIAGRPGPVISEEPVAVSRRTPSASNSSTILPVVGWLIPVARDKADRVVGSERSVVSSTLRRFINLKSLGIATKLHLIGPTHPFLKSTILKSNLY
jgi:hypothetical protein